MIIPENHEKLRIISEVVGETISKHTEEGGHYYDDRSAYLAAQAIHEIMPGLMSLQRTRVIVEAERGMTIDLANQPQTYDGLRVEAELSRVSIQGLISTMGEGDDALTMTSFDLFAVLRPRYVDPDPKDIVFGEELYVPFKDVQLFEAAQ